jgi:hypothetical protein
MATMTNADQEYGKEEVTFFREISEDILAQAIFRGGLVHPSPDATDEKKQWKSASDNVLEVFKAYNLEVASPTGKRYKAMNLHNIDINETKWASNRIVRFCCKKCKDKKTFSLIAVGTCVLEGGVGCLKMESVFYHNQDCSVQNMEDRKLPSDYCVVDFDYEEVIGDTYDSLVEFLKQFHFQLETSAPPGKHIDFGYESYNFDDRAYEYLPSDKYPQVKEGVHRQAMVRFFYLLVTYKNLAEEAAFHILDMGE